MIGRLDFNFIFERLKHYFMREHSEWVVFNFSLTHLRCLYILYNNKVHYMLITRAISLN